MVQTSAKNFENKASRPSSSVAKPLPPICVLLDLCFPYFRLVLRILTPIFSTTNETNSETLFTQHKVGTLETLAHTSEITHSCTHMQLYTAGNFRQRKISSKTTVRVFVRNLFSSNTGRLSFALQSFDRRSFDCRTFLHSWSNISHPTLPVCEKS